MRLAIAGIASGLLCFSVAAWADGWYDIFDLRGGQGGSGGGHGNGRGKGPDARGASFNRIATFANYRNQDDAGEATVSEIVAASKDGRLLVYTDASSESVGFVDLADPRDPEPLGLLPLNGSPTSVDILGNRYALVAVDLTDDLLAPDGELVVVDLATRKPVRTIPLGGQPDSLKISPDSRYAAIAIENQRNEDIEVGGVEGGLPQLPAGFLTVVDLANPLAPVSWTTSEIALTGLAGCAAPEDPEPEFVDINTDNIAVVSLQENNCIALIRLANGSVIRSFSAGAVSLSGIDADEDGVIELTDSLANIPREPDAIAWVRLPDGSEQIATANEGDLFGGSRGFSLFSKTGAVKYDSGNEFEHIAVRHGHYPEDRSENKGSEPEAVEYGRFGFSDYIFVGSERGSFVAVYRIGWNGKPEFAQLLPAPLGPEGLLAIPGRNLLVVSGEEDDPEFGVRSTMMIYSLERGQPDYPHIASNNGRDGKPIAWSALSGMTAAPGRGDDLLAVWDSYYSESRIFTIDPTSTPARITDAITITGANAALDPEGIAVTPGGQSYWIASEGNASDSLPNRLLQTDLNGVVIREVGLPAEIIACRAATTARGTLGSGFEGVAAFGSAHRYVLLVAQQRGWDYTTPDCEDLDDDGAGLDANGQPRQTRIWVFDPDSGEWSHFSWELASVPANARWVGLSEISATGWSLFKGFSFVLIERDNLTGDFSEHKTLVEVNLWKLLDGRVSQGDKSTFDLLPVMRSTNGWISDKAEGVAIGRRGEVYLSTDNDGVEDWSGETQFFNLGRLYQLF